MTCPRCGNTDIRTIQTNRMSRFDMRQHVCEPRENNPASTGCGKIFYSRAEIVQVQVYDEKKLQSTKVDVKEYLEKYLPFENNYRTNSQEGLF